MPWHGDHEEHRNTYEQYSSEPEKHKAKLSHELIAGAAAYEAAKAYQDHQAKNGKPASHEQAKSIAAGLVGAFIDKEFESKGLDFLDKEKAKRQAREHVEEGINRYGGYSNNY